MKLKLKQLNPNPFKKRINKGKLDEQQIEKIKSNLKDLGLMGALPIFKKDDKYYLINGHHRTEALKRTFGKDYEVEVVNHNYNEEQILRGMVIENLTQRANDFKEEVENLTAIRDYLKSNVQQVNETKESKRGRLNEGRPEESGSIRNIIHWLNKNGEVMSIGKISSLLNIHDRLDPELLSKVEKQSHATGEKEGETIGVKDAIALSSFEDKQEQKDLSKALLKSREQHGNLKMKNMTDYKESSEEIKKKVRKGLIDLADVKEEEAYKNSKKIKLERTANNIGDDILSDMSNLDYHITQLMEDVNPDDLSKSKMKRLMTTSGLIVTKHIRRLVNFLNKRGVKPDPIIVALIKADGKI